MIRRTLSQIRPELARIAGTSGFRVDDPRVIARLNKATEELMNEGDWPGVVDRYLFTTTNGEIVLPCFLDRIMGVAVNEIPYAIRSPWYEFVEFGPGPQAGCNWINAVIDRDETPIQVSFPAGTSGPWSLYTNCEVNEDIGGIRPVLEVQGRLANHRRVRSFYGTSYIDGEELDLNGVTPPYTFYGTAQFAEVTAVVKPETNGYVELWATNGMPADDVRLAVYSPNETTPSYHAYFLPTLSDICHCNCQQGLNPRVLTVLVRGRRRFIPVENPNDILIISNLPALESMAMAIQKREVSDIEGYVQYKLAATDIMRKEALSYRGKVKTPAITFDRGASFGSMIHVR